MQASAVRSGRAGVATLLGVLVSALAPNSLSCQPAISQRLGEDPGIRWVEVEPGTLTVGTGSHESEAAVCRFSMSATEITFGQYDAFCDATGAEKPDDNGWGRGAQPVFNVSYDDAAAFCRWLSEETGSAVRLPNQIEWLYAAQGGRHSGGYAYSGGNDKDEVSWNADNSDNRTHPVGTKKPNELGLFDMSGNVWEWCSDWPQASSRDAPGERGQYGDDDERPACGDSFDNPGRRMGYLQPARIDRDSRHINIGFRVVRSDVSGADS